MTDDHAQTDQSEKNPESESPLVEASTAPDPAQPAGAEHEPASAATKQARIRIGSQRPGATPTKPPKPAQPQPAPADPKPAVQKPAPAPKKYPPPNLRAELSADLEVEYAQALAGLSLEEMLAPGAAAGESELEPESRHLATVISIHRDDVFVDLGARKQGIVSLRTFSEPPEPGSQLELSVVRFNPAEGLYELTLPGGAVDVGDWSDVSEGMIVEARITGHNKGGLEADVNALRGFIPASQVSLYRVEDLSQFVDQRLRCVVTEANPEKRNLVLSHRAVLEREKAEAKQNLLAQLEVGQVREGTVRSLQEFGAFVDLGGIDGLIHISQLSWDRIRHASEVLEVGQKVKVKIQKIDPATGKIGLAFRDLAENPWASAAQKYPARSRVKGTVSRITEFGAFVRLEPGIEGLIHISELSHKRVWRPSDLLKEGEEVEVLVLSMDAEHQRIGLSRKALEARPAAEQKPADEEPEALEAPVEPAKTRKEPLKGGLGRASGGEQFGLKW